MKDKAWEHHCQVFVLKTSFWNRKRPNECQEDQLGGTAVLWVRSNEGKTGTAAEGTERSEQI